ncbi:Hpr(Ser) kinase/phosphatase [Sphingomonas gellani]|uniref:Hpr(Ser) kinase/phosphatase n=1 Tax=Sphingomonas gellani TaxID=1166340 RepID=A0A1H8FW69_9SPHN|nr:HprK-related kinase A [Sphingomonas gellani]SEN35922.1 Hpr(Ser) kinase/phosphatase [Sphingomonas gellani]
MRHSVTVRVGPAAFRVGADWRSPIEQLRDLYRDYPAFGGVPDFTVSLSAARPWRRWIRPSVAIGGDFTLPEAAPLPLAHGLLAAEMAMNLQMALGWRRHLLLHAATVERDGRALILCGESGAGKSTLAAMLHRTGWRLLGDEFALIDPATGDVHPFPRPISLKNSSVALLRDHGRWGSLLTGTPKGDIRHLIPDPASIAAMTRPAVPALLLFPRFGFDAAAREVGGSEGFVRLTTASTNYTGLGEAGFRTLTRLVHHVPMAAIDYPDTDVALTLIEELWR